MGCLTVRASKRVENLSLHFWRVFLALSSCLGSSFWVALVFVLVYTFAACALKFCFKRLLTRCFVGVLQMTVLIVREFVLRWPSFCNYFIYLGPTSLQVNLFLFSQNNFFFILNKIFSSIFAVLWVEPRSPQIRSAVKT